MRKISGVVLVILAVVFLVHFAAWGGAIAQKTNRTVTGFVPFDTLGLKFPYDVFYLAAGLWALGAGIYLLLRNPDSLPPRPLAQVFFLSSLLLVTFLFAAYVGAGTSQAKLVGLFAFMALVQVAVGLILLLLAFFEKPRGVLTLSIGGALYIAGSAVTMIIFLAG